MNDISDINTGASLLKRLFTGVTATAIAVIALLFAGPHFVPQSFEKSAIEKSLSYLLGYAVKIKGNTSFRLLPTFFVHAKDLIVLGSNTTNPDQTVMADIAAFELELGVFAFLADEIEIIKLHIITPQIRLMRDPSGDDSWDQDVTSVMSIKKPDLDWGWWQDMQIGDVQIANGRFMYSDPAKGQKIAGDHLNLQAFISSATGAGKGVSVNGSANVNGETVEVRVDIGAVEKLLTGGRLPVVAKLSSAFGLVSYQGAIAKRQYLVSDGRFGIEAPNIGTLEKWLGPLFDTAIDGGLKVTGRLSANGSRIAIDDLAFAAGENQISGKVLLTKGINGQQVDADLYLSNFDLQPFLTIGLNPSYLKKVHGIIKANWSRMSYGPVVSGPGEITFILKSNPRRIDIALPSTEIFGGQGRANVQLAMGEGMTSFKGQLELNRINAETLLEHFGNLAMFSGHGDLRLNLFSVGGNFDELLTALQGSGDFNLLGGQVHDEVLAEYLMKGSPGSVPFTQMIGSFSVHQGIIEGNDLLLKAPDLSLVGDGVIDLARDVVDVRLHSLSANKTKKGDDKLIIRPFRINGTLSELELNPEDS